MKVINRLVSILIVILFVFTLGADTATAASRDYIIDNSKHIPIPETYLLKDIIYNIRNAGEEGIYLKEPDDIFINEQGYIFVADTGNNRILKLNKEGELLATFKEADGKAFNSPRGVFADAKGDLYIADTGNQRIVHLNDIGEFVEQFTKPESNLLTENFIFAPTKLCVTPTGYIYVLRGENILILDAYNSFRGYLGQTDIGFKFLDVLLRVFASDEQKRVIGKRTAASYLNMSMDEEGMIYAVTMDHVTGEIKKLNSIGENIYRSYSTLQESANFFNLDFLTKMQLESSSFVFGERKDSKGEAVLPLFRDIVTDKNGIVNVVEERTGKIYQYDQEGNLLTTFGGKGDLKGRFNVPVSIEVDSEGCIYVVDRVLGNIQIFEPTTFILMVQDAVNLYIEGEYDKAYDAWQKVIDVHGNYPLARQGLAKALFKQKKWKESMDEFINAGDRDGYSKAFAKYRYELFREKFPIILVVLIFSVILLILALKTIKKLTSEGIEKYYKEANSKYSIVDDLKLSFGLLTHPVETFELIKNRRSCMNTVSGVIVLMLVFVVRVFYMFTVHYPLADIELRDSNIILEAVKLLLPVITWVIASYAVTSIVGGESKLKDVFISSSFCMLPYILINIPLSLISNILSRGETTLYGFITNIVWIWIFFLFFLQVKILNDFKVGKTIAVCIINIVTIVLIWAIGLMTYFLAGRLVQFITEVLQEIKMVIN